MVCVVVEEAKYKCIWTPLQIKNYDLKSLLDKNAVFSLSFISSSTKERGQSSQWSSSFLFHQHHRCGQQVLSCTHTQQLLRIWPVPLFDRLFSFFLDSKEDWWSFEWCHFQFILPERWKGLYQSTARTRHEPAWSAAEDERVQLKRWVCAAADSKHDTSSLKWVPATPAHGFSLNILSPCKFLSVLLLDMIKIHEF